jgi:GcrA cell cycle regulator
MYWTQERVENLVRLWAEGFSARQIAEKLGGVTRNAVIGKAHRLNLQRGTEVPEARPEPPPPVIVMPVFDPIPEAKHWMCRWPTDDPGRFGIHICGKTAQPGRPYCAEHLTAAYLQRKRTAA